MPKQTLNDLATSRLGDLAGAGWRASNLGFKFEHALEVDIFDQDNVIFCTANDRFSSAPLWTVSGRVEFEKCPPYLLIPANTAVHARFQSGYFESYVFQFSDDFLHTIKESPNSSTLVFGLNAATHKLIYIALLELTGEDGSKSETTADDLARCVAICAARMWEREASTGKAIDPSVAVEDAMRQIKENVRSKNQALDDVYKVTGMSARHLQRKFRDELGMSLQEFVTHFRIKLAKELLRNTGMALKTIAYDLGYANPSHFTRSFKVMTGMTPSVFRRNTSSDD